MPLTNAQKEFIGCSIDFLLEFPANKEELCTGISQLKTWVKFPPSNPDDNNIYYVLSRFLRSPETSFQHIEDYGSDATIQEVQEHVITLITTALQQTIASENISLSDIGWDITTPNSLFDNKTIDSTFKSVKVDFHIPLPWEEICDDNGVYNTFLTFNEAYTHVLVNITISLPGKSENIFICEPLCEIPNTEIDAYYFLKKYISEAKNLSRGYSVGNIIYQLKQSLALSEEPLDYSQLIDYFPLIANKVIADQLLKKKINLSQLIALTQNQIKSLSHPFATHLIDNDLCTLENAASISTTTLSAMQLYASLIEKRLLTIQHFIGLNKDKVKLLKHPLVINLIHTNKLTFKRAIKLPLITQKLFSSHLYADFFLNAVIKWSTFTRLKKKHVTILLNPNIANCIKNGLLRFDQVVFSNKTQRKKLRMEKIISLLNDQILSLHDLDKLSASKLELLNNHPLLHEWLRAKIISPNDFNRCSLLPLYTMIYTRRIEAIFNNNPYTLYKDGKTDSSASIFNEVSLAEWHLKSEPESLRKILIKKMIEHIREKVELAYTSNITTHTLHRNLLNFILALDKNDDHPEINLASIIQTANQLNKNPSCGVTLFGKAHADHEEYSTLCRQLNTLKPFAASFTISPTPIKQYITIQ